MGPTTYALLRNLVSPARPGDKTFAELVAPLNELVADFVAELRSLAEFCNFGASLNDMLRDRIVCGINSSKIQQRLLLKRT